MSHIVVHHLERSRSHRVLWLLEELELPYELVAYARDPKTMRAPPELAAIHPLGRSPLVTIDGVVLAESGAILEELVERFGGGRLRPEAPDALRQLRFWMHYAEGSLMPPLLVQLIVDKLRTAPVPFFLKPVTRSIAGHMQGAYSGPEIARHLRFVDDALAGRTWFLGDALTAADIQMSFPLEAASVRADLDGHPNIAAWLARARARPAYARAVARGGPIVLGH